MNPISSLGWLVLSLGAIRPEAHALHFDTETAQQRDDDIYASMVQEARPLPVLVERQVNFAVDTILCVSPKRDDSTFQTPGHR